MSEQWDFYFCHVDDEPASIFVDLGIRDEAPKAGFNHRAYLSLVMQNPRPDGLSSQEDFDSLKAIEDAVNKRLASADRLYVGRNTSNGRRDFWFYLARADDWDARITDFMRAFPDYRFETDTADDPHWDAYLNFLYPNDEGLDFMSNRAVCDKLEADGDPLTEPRDIDHWAYFPSAESRDAFIARTAELGFSVRNAYEAEGDDRAFCVHLFHSDIPSHRNITDITVPLLRAAREVGGKYDGWETQVLSQMPRSSH